MKTIKKKIIEEVVERLFEYLEMTPKEQEEKKQLYKEKLGSLKTSDMMKASIKRLGIWITCTVLMMLYAIEISEPMRSLFITIFKKTKPVSAAFADFTPKLFEISLVFIASFSILLLFVWAYNFNEHKEGIKRDLLRCLRASSIIGGIALISALFYTFATGDVMPIIQQIITLATPSVTALMVAVITGHMIAIAVSAVYLWGIVKEIYAKISKIDITVTR